MWKFLVFALIVLLILMFIQVSSLSEKDIEKMRENIEQQKTDVEPDADKNVAGETAIDDIAEPVRFYEEFLDAIPSMNFFSEVSRFLTPDYIENYQNRYTEFSSDPFKAFKDLHDLTGLEYMDINVSKADASFIYIASSKLMRQMMRITFSEESNIEGLVECKVNMLLDSGNWLVTSESCDSIPEKFSLSNQEKSLRKQRLAEYYTKHSNRR